MLVIKDLKYKFSLNNKNTARCPEQYVAADDANNLYLVVHARTDTQIFYAKRAIENQEIFDEHEHTDFKCNLPLFSGFLEDGFYAIYHYFENANEINDEYPHYWLLDFYKNNSFEINICDEEIEKIEEGFLNAFPEKYRNQIKLLKEFKLFRDELSKHNKLSVCFQHGDFTPNNLLIVNSSTRYIMDFEFSQRHQPIGFDLFDFHYSTDKNYSNIPYLNINKIKEELQNKVNELIDSFSHPKLINNNEEMASFEPTHWSDDIIYNRPDLYEPMNFYLRVVYEGCIYVVRYYIKRYKAVICVWLRPIPSQVLDFVIDYVFKKHRFVMKIDIKYSTVNYKNTFIQDNNWVVFLPSQPNDIINRLSKKSKYNLKREMRLLEDECGTLSVFHYTKEYIPRFIFDLYFEWKKKSHGTDYGMSPKEYLNVYHVTNSMALSVGDKVVAILFYCVTNKTIYLENISYDIEYSKYSPGIILYEKFLEKATAEKMEAVVLGNGDQMYKTRFGSVEYIVFDGVIFRNIAFKLLNKAKVALKGR